jgi:signal transduction histidine kinase
VVDDEIEIIKSLRRQFRRNYKVLIANGAEEAQRLMEEHSVQVIISDQRMPGMTGSEFYTRIKEEYPDAIRLLLTGYADISAVIDAINDGNVFRYVTKPWDPLELDTIVRESFERYRLIVERRRLMEQLREANESLEERVRQRTSELAEANQRLQALNEQKNEFIGMAAHDLRSPLSVIKGFASLMYEEAFPIEERREYLDHMIESSRKLLNLIDGLLDFQKIEQGKVRVEPAPVDLVDFLTTLTRMNRALAESKGLKLEMTCGADLPLVPHFDSTRVGQVLNNLISNAVKFSHPGTTIMLEINGDSEFLVFAVRDQGLGIPPDEVGKVFGAFSRTSTRATAGEASSGLGLAICKRIVAQHGGEISVESTLGVGSCFTVRLPCSGDPLCQSE